MLIRLVFAVVLLFSASNVKARSATIVQAPKAVNPDWWKTSVIYQIYPRSFKDSDNDGSGDINGIISKLEHLKDAGVTAAWLSPIYESPQIDAGYDISNYKEIDPLYGTMQDFENMVERAHALGIKIVMDFVPNHSSNDHEWFQKSEENVDLAYSDYYIWRDGKDDKTPPNNWVSHFKGKAWSYSATRGKWYLHQFAPDQPDLNYRSEAVKTEMKEIIKFWLDKGVDGFRMDAVPYLIEDEKFEDEPLSGDPTAKEGDYEYLTHTLTSDQDGTYAIIYEWRAFIDQYNQDHSDQDPKIMMTEAYTSLEKTMKYYTDGTRDGAHFTFNFLFITDLDRDSKAQDIVAVTERWLNLMPEGCVANWVLGNHDNHRVATRFGPERADGLNMLIAFLPGVMVTYNGEEIGQENGDVPKEKCKDPRACKLDDEDEYRAASRDFERTPFHWDDTPNAGFTTGGDPWLPVSDKYTENNLAKQSVVGINSHYHTYKELLKLRQIPGFGDTNPSFTAVSDNVITLIKSIPEGDTYVVVINIAGEQQEVDLSGFTELNKYVKVVVANSNSKKHNRVLTANNIVLEPYESFVAISITKVEGSLDWWKHAVVYQIYPLSFKDDIKNDGIGDIPGIISKLVHLEDAGVTAAWLSPIYDSPDVDQGYDIRDFKKIDEKFGTIEDFEEMVAKAHDKGIKIIMDFVPNHSSDQHQWFIDSENQEAGYEDYYIWKSSENDEPPNNWKSIFGGSAWEYSEKRRQWYLHQFAKEQPDLNYRNPAVVKEMKNVLEFWLEKGVDGFRMDAVPYLFEDKDFRNDELIQGRPGTEWSDYDHIRTSDQDGTFDMIYQWREFVDDYSKEHGGDARVLMTEAYTNIENTMKYYGDGEGREGAHFTFNFQLITKLNTESNAKDIKEAILEWLENMPEEYTANWVLGNHDNPRVATRFGPDNADGFNMLIAILPGVMVTYNGEEIAQENGEVPYAKCKDPSVCGKGEEIFLAKGRDFERTPFHWEDTANAGFNTGNAEPWLPVSEKYLTNNLKAQSNSEELSPYQVYKQLLKLRENLTLVKGKLAIEAISDNVLGCIRTLEGSDTYIYIFNVGNTAETIDIKELIDSATPYLDVVLTDSKSPHTMGQLVVSGSIELGPHESIIARTTIKVPSTTTTITSTITTTPKPNGATGIAVSLITLFLTLFCILMMN